MRDLFGVVQAEGAQKGILICSGVFTEPAKAWAQQKPIQLIDGTGLLHLLGNVQQPESLSKNNQPTQPLASLPAMQVEAIPSCPYCGADLVKRTARRGSNAGKAFWGCSDFPKCRGTRAI